MVREEVILVVDDETDLVAIFERALQRAGYTVLSANTGEQALRVIEENGGKVDLVISDVVMPGMGGRELVWRLQTQYPRIPTILLSGYADREAALEMMEGDEPLFLEKPIDLTELTDIVGQVLSERKA
jgi:two-component system, cell cycle sensor histidine kinase and response regulator CckA